MGLSWCVVIRIVCGAAAPSISHVSVFGESETSTGMWARTVKRMDGLASRAAGNVQEFVCAEIRLGAACRPNAKSFVCALDKLRPCVGLGEDGDSLDSESFCRALDAACNLAAVRNQNLVKERLHLFEFLWKSENLIRMK